MYLNILKPIMLLSDFSLRITIVVFKWVAETDRRSKTACLRITIVVFKYMLL